MAASKSNGQSKPQPAQLAIVLGHDEIADMLAQTLEEEKQTDGRLTEIAEDNVNWEAEQEKEEE